MINQAGVELIKKAEGFRSRAYKCPAGIWTVGFGHTKNVTPNRTVTLDEAIELIYQDAAEAEAPIKKYVKVPLNENQLSALISFVFNLGETKFAGSTLLKKLNEGSYDLVGKEMQRWIFARQNGVLKKLGGLIKRRQAEMQLFNTKPNN